MQGSITSPPPPLLGIFYVEKWTLSIINFVTIKHVKRRLPLNDVFQACVVRFSIVSFTTRIEKSWLLDNSIADPVAFYDSLEQQ